MHAQPTFSTTDLPDMEELARLKQATWEGADATQSLESALARLERDDNASEPAITLEQLGALTHLADTLDIVGGELVARGQRVRDAALHLSYW